ncbi:aldehyde dehydrogenase (NAD+) [Palleronia marisminoris]|uniref:Aldehyde dehydrogenase, thermostable n=1 Tax=Palleronia marisminoris TaxID=315423 RepID=A0A1Y5TQF5_9RHOB|nr:aldehyde dehydrogenase family protein [Palleronia marisminoris]SFH48592.1 aldehyde dehydrogenase (NAD+) [Palleronia marisminoris]SLN69473.1 Aldehyde dehydrogenase, thermostable [Palleronia marisminoris]
MIYANFIDGREVQSADAVENVNPSDTDDVIGQFARAQPKDVDDAVAAARRALPGWAASLPGERHDILRRAADEIFARKEELGRALSREEGKTLAEGIGEVVRAGQLLGFFAGEALRLSGELLPSVRPGVEVGMTREPLGVVGLITPWNFPIAIPAWKIAPALAWGNAVVFKPAELVPHSAWLLVDILNRAGLPKGVLNLVMGQGSRIGQAMIDHPDIEAISFTGSVATGRRIAAGCVAATPMKKVQLEMGGKNPFVVLDDADLEVAVEAAVNGAFFSTGQRCTASSRLIVTERIHDRFVAALIDKIDSLRVGHALKEGTQIGPVVDQGQLEIDQRYLEIGRREGATLKHGGRRLEQPTAGFYLEPALFTEVNNGMAVAREEIFGPVAAVIRVRDYDEALAVSNDTEFGLSAGIATTSLKYASHFRRHAQAGMVMVNLPTAGVDYHVAFGGRKASSYGAREQGAYSREFYSIMKTAYVAS